MSLKQSLKKVIENGTDVIDTLDTISSEIRTVEGELIDLNICIPYSSPFEQEITISWDKWEEQGKFRLLLGTRIANGEYIIKPLIAYDRETRVEGFHLLGSFLDSFGDFLYSYNQSLVEKTYAKSLSERI